MEEEDDEDEEDDIEDLEDGLWWFPWLWFCGMKDNG
jgi:hypothetical protein